MLQENLRDNAEILQNILHQSLEISGAPENISLIQAVESYSSQQSDHSDLSRMMRTFSNNPKSLERLIQELHLVVKELP
jgi:acetolactate synthase small subunit